MLALYCKSVLLYVHNYAVLCTNVRILNAQDLSAGYDYASYMVLSERYINKQQSVIKFYNFFSISYVLEG